MVKLIIRAKYQITIWDFVRWDLLLPPKKMPTHSSFSDNGKQILHFYLNSVSKSSNRNTNPSFRNNGIDGVTSTWEFLINTVGRSDQKQNDLIEIS